MWIFDNLLIRIINQFVTGYNISSLNMFASRGGETLGDVSKRDGNTAITKQNWSVAYKTFWFKMKNMSTARIQRTRNTNTVPELPFQKVY